MGEGGMADHIVQTVKLAIPLHIEARKRMAETPGMTYQRVLEAAVRAYAAGEFNPAPVERKAKRT